MITTPKLSGLPGQAPVELGYATTAHRAQGRTVDTCHAYVSAATVREPLYVMATRGREANRLYVDTSYDPDTDTAHEIVEPVAVGQLLRKVLATSGADLSATETRISEVSAAMSPAHLEAEGAAIQNHRRQQRYLELLLKAGVSRDEIALAKTADRWRPLLAQMRHAERLGLDLEAAGPVAPHPAPVRSLAQFEADIRAWCDLREGAGVLTNGIVNRAALGVEGRPRLGLER